MDAPISTREKTYLGRTISFIAKAFYWVLILLIAWFVFVTFLSIGLVGGNANARTKSMLTGTAFRPFAYRVLMPATADLLASVVKKRVALQLGTRFENMLHSSIYTARLNGRAYPREVLLLLILMYLSLVGFAITMWHFLAALGYSSPIRYAAPPLMLLGTLLFFFGFGYIYDFSTLFLFALGLLLMARQKWIWFLIVFALGTLNKETTIFLCLIFGLYYFGRIPRRKFIILAASQLAIYGIIQGIIRFTYRNNPGDPVELHIQDQLPAYTSIAQHTPYWLVIWAAACIIVTILILRRWSEKPLFARVALAIFPVLLVLFIFWGYPLEIRSLLEVFPVVAILMLPPPAAIAPAGAHAAI